MKEFNKSYWLYLNPFVYVAVKNNQAILYNTLSHKLLEYKDKEIIRIIKKLISERNLYVARLYGKEITDNICEFIEEIKKYFMGGLINTTFSLGKPIQLTPVLSLQKSIEGLTFGVKNDKILRKDSLKDYIDTIYLYINNQCNQSCEFCKSYYKQFPFCFKTNKKHEVNIEEINFLLNELKGSKLYKLNILGGNILLYSRFSELIDLLNRNTLKKEYFIHYLNLIFEKDLYMMDNQYSSLSILFNFPLKESLFEGILNFLNHLNKNFCFKFIVETEKNIEDAENLISKYKIKSFAFFPFFNGRNINFFRRNVFIDKKAILESSSSMKDIFIRKTLNKFTFRKLIILSDKKIYGNINNPSIGKFGQDNIIDIIAKELNKGSSWKKVRKNVWPCKMCVFYSLCPSISNYEYVIGKWNLCNIYANET
ncbi:MAG: TIGR04150 pseudo-rSAM protein [candidate division WOR-3 bacterium]